MANRFLREANLIGGAWVQADSGKVIDVTNPATGEKIGTVPRSGAAETRRAIDAAQEAFLVWRKTSALHRSQMLRKLHDAIMDNQLELAELLTLEQGKPLAEAKGEVGMSAGYVLWFAEEARRIYGDIVPSPWADRRILVAGSMRRRCREHCLIQLRQRRLFDQCCSSLEGWLETILAES